VTVIQSLGVLLGTARPTTAEEVSSAPEWRGVREFPSRSPGEMAIETGRSALSAAAVAPSDVAWLIHCGSGYQGSTGWPVHHHIQQGVIGTHGNGFEVRQLCAGGLTSWLIADRLAVSGAAVICTGADNWSWTDRFGVSRSDGGEPFSDVAHAAVFSTRGGFAKILGSGTVSRPEQAQPWRTREAFWEYATMAHFRSTFARVAETRTPAAARDSFDMLVDASATALKEAQISPQYVTHFVPHSSGSGEPYRSVAKVLGLPWQEDLHQNNLDNGYLGVSTQAAGLVSLAMTGSLKPDSIVLLLAAEYQLSATAVVLRVIHPPVVSINGPVHTLHE
jgi:3-oxoacyl-[acyl-carrier-protein] synthase III